MKAILLKLWSPATLLIWAVTVAFLTLRPSAMGSFEDLAGAQTCLICGTRGTADAILNVALFLPLGVVLASARRAWFLAGVVGLALSLLIEWAQLAIPGRHAGIADLVWNSFGAVGGVALVALVGARLRRELVGAGELAAVGTAALLVLAGYLLAPAQTDADYWGQWVPDLGSMPQYQGKVVEATLSDIEFRSRRLDAPPPHRRLLEQPWALHGTVVASQGTRAVSPILSIYDGKQREILLLGVHGGDLVFRERNWARHFRFDSPDHRIPGAFGTVSPGDTIRIGARREGRSLCLGLNETEECGLGSTPGRSWGLLLYLEGPTESIRDRLDLVWLILLFAPLGFLAHSRAALARSAAVGLTGYGVSVLATPFVFGSAGEPLACLLGLLVGAAAAWILRRVVGADQARPCSSAIAPKV